LQGTNVRCAYRHNPPFAVTNESAIPVWGSRARYRAMCFILCRATFLLCLEYSVAAVWTRVRVIHTTIQHLYKPINHCYGGERIHTPLRRSAEEVVCRYNIMFGSRRYILFFIERDICTCAVAELYNSQNITTHCTEHPFRGHIRRVRLSLIRGFRILIRFFNLESEV
jgi:hypothetical protein